MSNEPRNCFVGAVTALLCIGFVGVALAATEKYQVYLSQMPHNAAMQANFSGKGVALVTFDGNTMSLSGSFSGLVSAATKAHVCVSKGPGIPGTPIFEITVPPAVEGKVTGAFKLDETQAAALKKGRLYIQIDSEKAPTGNLWGWLLTEHEATKQDVPQVGPWFQPQFSVKTK